VSPKKLQLCGKRTGDDEQETSRDEQETGKMRLVDSIIGLGGLLVPIVAILVGGAIAITTMILRHQERIAKIERGIDPDAGTPRS
jgi:hypothetical protein